ncbi:hypothetical protein CGRA01v4_10087 [Colletotrichum graminicola]|nr:hypothetical protein CGRA01v4_10087 [Colletotrichum graminicola]
MKAVWTPEAPPPNNPFLFSSRTKARPPSLVPSPASWNSCPSTPPVSPSSASAAFSLLPSHANVCMSAVPCKPFLSRPCVPTTEEASYRPHPRPS